MYPTSDEDKDIYTCDVHLCWTELNIFQITDAFFT